ncbi:hypothetical protein N0V93_009801 [Gnomoniopsis smithogilvyi]|uniref:AB hydrolase-1 domain-containing protein n=1 Tax=Gnomoniopsis smithogilvyi TaxID=1191159 RepID=A0A9W8YNU2_9PEZI|nr:hypothetical protein N0V93_009801 [Gnomoniopsis smithogilvyi]
MTPRKPSVVLVHGAWHVPASYAQFVTALEANGYEVLIPHLTSTNGTKPAEGDLYTDTAQVRECIAGLVSAGKTVIALLHSYGGQVGSNALCGLSVESRSKQGLAGGILRLIYICAFLLPENRTLMQQAEAFVVADPNAPQLSFAFDDQGYCTMADGRDRFINCVSDEIVAAAYMATVGPWSVKCMNQPLTHCAWKEVQVIYIHTNKDMTIPMHSQQMMVDRAKQLGLEDLEIISLDTDHSPHLSATKELVAIVNKAASQTCSV